MQIMRLSYVLQFLDEYFPFISVLIMFLIINIFTWYIHSKFQTQWLKGTAVLANDFVKVINGVVFFSSVIHLFRFWSAVNLIFFGWTLVRTSLLYRGHTFVYLLLDVVSLSFASRQMCFWGVDQKAPDIVADSCSTHSYWSGLLTAVPHGAMALVSDWKPFLLFFLLLLHFYHLHYVMGAPVFPVASYKLLELQQHSGRGNGVDVSWKFFFSLLFTFGLTFYLARLSRGLYHNFRQVFARYVSTPVAEELLSNPNENLKIGGERRHVCIVLSDLRGFSSLLSTIEPEEAIGLMNGYLENMLEIIDAHGGTVDEIIGDALLVIFGLQNKMLLVNSNGTVDEAAAAGAAMSAVRCAAAMQQAMDRHPRLNMGIGIHSGECVVGNIGSKRRCKYGIIGSAINMAARVESFSLAFPFFRDYCIVTVNQQRP